MTKIQKTIQTIPITGVPDWMSDFLIDQHIKKAHGPDYLKTYFDKLKNKKSFSSIDEKLADIKNRIGFDIANKLQNELETIEKTSKEEKELDKKASCNCGCGGCSITKSAFESESNKSSVEQSKIDRMSQILSFIQDMIASKDGCSTVEVFSRLNDLEMFRDLKGSIDLEKLTKYIDSVCDEKNKTIKEQDLKYQDPVSNEQDENQAEYFGHARPAQI